MVKLAQHVHNLQRVALKIYKISELSDAKRQSIECEIRCMIILEGSEFFPKLIGTFETQNFELVLVQEYVSGNSLLRLMQHKAGPYKED